MTALSKGRLTPYRDGGTRELPVAAATRIWEGAMVANNAGVMVPAAATAALVILGFADATADNSGGVAGAINVRIKRDIARMNNDPADALTAADIGKACYVTDDNTVAKTSNSNAKPQAGTVFDVDAQGVWVKFA